VMLLMVRSKADVKTLWSGPSSLRDPTDRQPELPQVMFAGLGRGLAATASACPANKAEAVTAEASRRLCIVESCQCNWVVREDRAGSEYKEIRLCVETMRQSQQTSKALNKDDQ
jgi:hypothetical protein